MRVVGGRLKGRRLFSSRAASLRPTTDKVREAVFDILASRLRLEGLRVLDLFAGTGAMGIEAMSRGASGAVFVEKDRSAVSVIRKNLEVTRLAESAVVINRDASGAIRALTAKGERFSLVFMDAPYDTPLTAGTIEELATSSILGPGAIIVAETSKRTELDATEGLELTDKRRYGDTALWFFTAAASGTTEAAEGGDGGEGG